MDERSTESASKDALKEVFREAFKETMSRLASGVTIITTRSGQDRPSGFTATSFSSLSLAPPQVLFCLGHEANCHADFVRARGFAVNVLSAAQESLSQHFASKAEDKFDQLNWQPSPRHGYPLLPGALATLECTIQARHESGDHTIYVGHVEGTASHEGSPLLHFRGGYRQLG